MSKVAKVSDIVYEKVKILSDQTGRPVSSIVSELVIAQLKDTKIEEVQCTKKVLTFGGK